MAPPATGNRSTVIDSADARRPLRGRAGPCVPAGIAAGHPITAEVGQQVLRAGGSAADAAVAAVLACCVAESVLTGIAGGGFATYYDAGSRTVSCLDFFCAIPGLDGDVTAGPMVPIEIRFGGLPMSYSIGAASVGVPGVPAGVGEVHRRWGRLRWDQVVAPAIGIARTGVAMPPAQALALATVAPAMVPGHGAGIYSPAGRLLQAGDLLHHPGLDVTMTALAEHGPDVFYTGWIAERVVEAVRAGRGAIGPADLAGYRVLELPVERGRLADTYAFGRRDLNDVIGTLDALPAEVAGLPRPDRAVAVARALLTRGRERVGDTTNIAVVDPQGNACVITVTLGLGSGVWLPGLGIHLNSMLGEGELADPRLAPGARMSSMMCPLVVVDAAGELLAAAGSAGASRIRTALVHTLVNALLDGDDMATAIGRPRFHVVAGAAGQPPVLHAEPAYPEDELAALAAVGYHVHRWDHTSHYFGGASAVGGTGAAGDPRRGGVGLLS